MRSLWLASIVVLALGTTAGAHTWRAYRPYQGSQSWRTPGVPNKISADGLWWRGYGRMGYGWYRVDGNYIGYDYNTFLYGTMGFGYQNRPSDPWTIGAQAR